MTNNKKMMFDVVSAVDREGVGNTEIDLKESSDLPNQSGVSGIPKKRDTTLDDLVEAILDGPPVRDPKEELERLLNTEVNDPIAELAGIGAVLNEHAFKIKNLKYQIENSELKTSDSNEDFYNKIIAHIRTPISEGRAKMISSDSKPEVKIEAKLNLEKNNPKTAIVDFYNKKPDIPLSSKLLNFSAAPKKKVTKLWFVVLIGFGLVTYGFTLKNEIVRDGTSALGNLESAKEDLKSLDFSGAAESFRESYEDFVKAGDDLNFMGADIASIVASLPGGGKVKAAKDLIEAGKSIAQAGQAMSEALSRLAQTGSILNPADISHIKPSRTIAELRDALTISINNINNTKTLLANIDSAMLPEDKRESFNDFKNKIPIFESVVEDAVGYAEFLESFIGIDEPKKYLFLFQNSSELRPTGGFPGSYGVISFSGGGLENFFVDDVYNLDGQLKRNIIPPKQLQHITPTWGMRDSAWFADFPESARKASQFFREEAGYGVDGVVALNPDIVSGILNIIGPIEIPQYNMVLDGNNFLESVQEEVEYGENRVQPKKILSDFMPRFLDKLYSAPAQKWLEIFSLITVGLEEKDILMYFEDKGLEKFVIEKGFGGEIKNTGDDYLMINFSNIKGSKTDAVTRSSAEVHTTIKEGKAIHKLVIKRDHQGGSSEYGFYNRTNSAYARILIPLDAELISVSGNDQPNYLPLVNYNQIAVQKDGDLQQFESGFYKNKEHNVEVFSEAGKKGIGFWMITQPGTVQTVEIEYAVPVTDEKNYDFYFQKQSGLDWKNFFFILHAQGDQKLADSIPFLDRIGDIYVLEKELKKDQGIRIKF